MNATELAKAMLEWEEMQRKADELAEAIKNTVMKIGKTQTVGNVRASFRSSIKRYDYQSAADGHPAVREATLELFTKKSIDWRGVCKHAGIEDVPFTQSEPSVSLKLLQ